MPHLVKLLANVDKGCGAELLVVEVLMDFVHQSEKVSSKVQTVPRQSPDIY